MTMSAKPKQSRPEAITVQRRDWGTAGMGSGIVDYFSQTGRN